MKTRVVVASIRIVEASAVEVQVRMKALVTSAKSVDEADSIRVVAVLVKDGVVVISAKDKTLTMLVGTEMDSTKDRAGEVVAEVDLTRAPVGEALNLAAWEEVHLAAKTLMDLPTEGAVEEDSAVSVAREVCSIRWDVDEEVLVRHFSELSRDRSQTRMTLLKIKHPV